MYGKHNTKSPVKTGDFILYKAKASFLCKYTKVRVYANYFQISIDIAQSL